MENSDQNQVFSYFSSLNNFHQKWSKIQSSNANSFLPLRISSHCRKISRKFPSIFWFFSTHSIETVTVTLYFRISIILDLKRIVSWSGVLEIDNFLWRITCLGNMFPYRSTSQIGIFVAFVAQHRIHVVGQSLLQRIQPKSCRTSVS